ncbi:nitronate monooxygenase [Nonomuraea sp. M3C6]|uniref:Nitronate monooxygenase n=1 Tax=Nonomuraea marmarensis TaxID=3351344 RepID=A0ABW7AHZ4_9ACTN
MALSTAFTKLFGMEHPIALAPMGGSAGGELTAAVSRGGGLGLLGGGNGDREWLARELPIVAEGTAKPWGVGFLSWAIDVGAKYTARTLGHPYLDQWRGREAELAADPQAKRAYQDAVARGDLPPLPVWAGEAVDLITDLPSAAELVATLAAQAEDALARAGRH